MRSISALAAFVAFAAAAPAPQMIDANAVAAVKPPPKPSIPIVNVKAQATTVSLASTAAAVVAASVAAPDASDAPKKRDRLDRRDGTCASQAPGAGPVPTPDTPDAFLSYSAFGAAASAAQTPAGYTNTFKSLKFSNNAYGYMGYTLLDSYDVQGCSKRCDGIDGCAAFNIYFERDPLQDPNAVNCPNPSSTTNIKCVFWGGPVTTENAVNAGQWRDSFQVVIAGSNGYVNKSIEPAQGYSQPTYLGNAAINAPLNCNNADTYMGFKIFQGGAFDARLCAAACSDQSAYNLAHPPSDRPAQTCQFFNTYLLSKNGIAIGQYCSMYSQEWGSQYGTNTGYWYGSDHYTVSYSYTFTNSANNGSPVCV